MELARAERLPPDGDWNVWLYLAGRGAGKTRTAAEWLAYEAISRPETRWAIVAPTYKDARDTCAEGVSGILTICCAHIASLLFAECHHFSLV